MFDIYIYIIYIYIHTCTWLSLHLELYTYVNIIWINLDNKNPEWDVFHAPLQEEKKSTDRAQQSFGKKRNWQTTKFNGNSETLIFWAINVAYQAFSPTASDNMGAERTPVRQRSCKASGMVHEIRSLCEQTGVLENSQIMDLTFYHFSNYP